MVRFIFVCMFVVALSIVATASQFMIDGIEDARQSVVARNEPAPEATSPQPSAVTTEEDILAQQMNAIDTAAGASEEEDLGFGTAFRGDAPKALVEQEPMPSVLPEAVFPSSPENAAN